MALRCKIETLLWEDHVLRLGFVGQPARVKKPTTLPADAVRARIHEALISGLREVMMVLLPRLLKAPGGNQLWSQAHFCRQHGINIGIICSCIQIGVIAEVIAS